MLANNKIIINTLKRTLRHAFGINDQVADAAITKYFTTVNLWIKSEGVVHAVKRLKGVYALAVQAKMNHRQNFTQDQWTSLDKGFPRSFTYLKKLIYSKKVKEVRAGLTVLKAYTLIETPVDYNVDTIVSPYTGTDLYDKAQVSLIVSDLASFFKFPVLERTGYAGRGKFKWHISNSGGPNGSPAFVK